MKKEYYWLGAIMLCALAVRLFFAFQTPEFSADTAYYTVRQVDHIHQTFLPLFSDSLSYGGRTNFLLPLFYYILAVPAFLLKSPLTLKFMANLLAVSLVWIVYLTVKHLTNSKESAMFSAVLAATIPLFMRETMNTLSIYAEVIPLIFAGLYALIRIQEGTRWIIMFLGVLLVLRLSTTMVIFLIIILWAYKALTSLERMPKIKVENEVILFATVLIIWTLFVGFKSVFLQHGIGILWQTIPESLLEQHFSVFTFPSMYIAIGIVPLVLGLYAIVRSLTIQKQRSLYPFISAIIVGILLMVVHIIEPVFGLLLIAASLCVLSGMVYHDILGLKTMAVRNALRMIVVVAALLLMAVPSVIEARQEISHAYSAQEIDSLEWMNDMTPKDTTVVSSIPDGHLITAIAQRKNIMDTNFLFAQETDARLTDVYTMYRSPSQTEVIDLMEKYNATYLYVSPHSLREYNVLVPPAIDGVCFKKVYEAGDVMVFKRKCKLETI